MSLLLLFNQPPYHETLLGLARTLHEEKRHQLVVVTAQMACEIVGEQVLSSLLSQRIGGLEKSVSGLVPGHHLRHKGVRDLFDALSGGSLADEPWWRDYDAHVKRRNNVVHGGAAVDEAESSASLRAAAEFCSHLRALAPTS